VTERNAENNVKKHADLRKRNTKEIRLNGKNNAEKEMKNVIRLPNLMKQIMISKQMTGLLNVKRDERSEKKKTENLKKSVKDAKKNVRPEGVLRSSLLDLFINFIL